eukprot:NODE_35_length_3187_cov_13.257489_g31_i0.p1 GENE.NODE_35_length_3187_cov_13.257489_g31_i0~~NODE_35_length_3187_cov_13.257489_g31_i0.p1  ORF type:complete len:115 (+),score=11.66 NODE_35_length_3187_cov_13.257489_g31_i0:637-981(+)
MVRAARLFGALLGVGMAGGGHCICKSSSSEKVRLLLDTDTSSFLLLSRPALGRFQKLVSPLTGAIFSLHKALVPYSQIGLSETPSTSLKLGEREGGRVPQAAVHCSEGLGLVRV